MKLKEFEALSREQKLAYWEAQKKAAKRTTV